MMKILITIFFISMLPLLAIGQHGKLKGLVRELYSGKPVEKVQVKLIPSNLTMETDSSGAFSFDSLAIGEYSVIFTKIGYLQHVVPCIKVEPDTVAFLRIIMERVPPPVKDPIAPKK